MRKLLLPLLFLLSFNTNAQLLKDINGRPYLNTLYEEHEGNPLLFPGWTSANVISSDGQVYEGMMINVDVYKDIPLFLRDNQVFSFLENIVEFTVQENGQDVVYKKAATINNKLTDGFYKVIQTEPLLVKLTRKTLVDLPGYGSITKKKFTESKVYFVGIGRDVHKVSLTKGDAEKVFAPKWKVVNAYATKNKLSFKNELAWQVILQQYNTL